MINEILFVHTNTEARPRRRKEVKDFMLEVRLFAGVRGEGYE